MPWLVPEIPDPLLAMVRVPRPGGGKKYSWVGLALACFRRLNFLFPEILCENGSAYNMGTALAPLLTLENFAAASAWPE